MSGPPIVGVASNVEGRALISGTCLPTSVCEGQIEALTSNEFGSPAEASPPGGASCGYRSASTLFDW